MNTLLRENAGLIFPHHHFNQVSANQNFPLPIVLNQDGWLSEIHQALELVSDMNTDESFRLNFSMAFILMHRETAELRFFVPHDKKPVRIDHPPLGGRFILIGMSIP